MLIDTEIETFNLITVRMQLLGIIYIKLHVFFFCSTLSGLVEFDGFYLESDPCLVCNNPEVPFSVSETHPHTTGIFFFKKCTGSQAN